MGLLIKLELQRIENEAEANERFSNYTLNNLKHKVVNGSVKYHGSGWGVDVQMGNHHKTKAYHHKERV